MSASAPPPPVGCVADNASVADLSASVSIVISVAVALLVIGIGTGLCLASRRIHHLEQRNLDKQLDMITQCLCDQAESSAGRLNHPLILLRAQDFLTGGQLLMYEDLRKANRLMYIDTAEQLQRFEGKQRIIFFSHRATPALDVLRAAGHAKPTRPSCVAWCFDRVDGLSEA
jgi:hypothetical protein